LNADLTGTVRMAGEAESAIRVEIRLEDEELRLVSRYGELGRWPLEDVGVSAKLDGFHLRIEGEELVLSTSDDAKFALALGIRSSNSPRLNRLLASARDVGSDVEGRLSPPAPSAAPPGQPWPSEPSVNTAPVAMGLFGAAALQFLAGLVGLASGSSLRMFGLLPAWPVWMVASTTAAIGGFALLHRLPRARSLVAAGTVIGLLTLMGSLLRIADPSFSWITDGVVFGGSGSVLAGLLLSVDLLNRGR
jgi:hypothetical protein